MKKPTLKVVQAARVPMRFTVNKDAPSGDLTPLLNLIISVSRRADQAEDLGRDAAATTSATSAVEATASQAEAAPAPAPPRKARTPRKRAAKPRVPSSPTPGE